MLIYLLLFNNKLPILYYPMVILNNRYKVEINKPSSFLLCIRVNDNHIKSIVKLRYACIYKLF